MKKIGAKVSYKLPKFEIDKNYKEVEAFWNVSGVVIHENSDFVIVARDYDENRVDHFCPTHQIGNNEYRGDKLLKSEVK